MHRIADIRGNLDYASAEYRALGKLIGDAQASDSDVTHIGQKAGSILSAVRECFDFAAADIREDFLPPTESRKVYYPFHPDSLGKGRPLHDLANSHPKVFAVLMRIASAMEAKAAVPDTISGYDDLAAVNKLVNMKKHDRVLQVKDHPNALTRITMPDGSVVTITPIYTMGANGRPDFTKPSTPVGRPGWTDSPDVKIEAVKTFVFDAAPVQLSRGDIQGFCMCAITAARFVLSELYADVYEQSRDLFK